MSAPGARGRGAAPAHRLSLERIAAAAQAIAPVFLDSPQYRAEAFDDLLDCRLVVKVETLNPIRSFKGRGTELLMATWEGTPALVCATAGNFGQGMAWSARVRGRTVTVYAARTANPMKVERMRALGADVRLAGDDADAAHDEARRFAAATGARLVEDGRDVAISEGAGTIAIELLRDPEPLDALLVPVGDGALLAGVGRWFKAHRPATLMIGVCASGAPAMERSWRAGEVRELEPPRTIADGIALRAPFAEALADLVAVVDDIVLVDDTAILAAMRHAHERLGLVLEPAGAAALAAAQVAGGRFRGQRVGAILTGGNITPAQMREWLGG